MASITETLPELVAGDRLTRAEFLRRWEAMSEVKKAELIGGIVYMPSPLSREHGVMDSCISGWLITYAAHTPGCEAASNATWLMAKDAPQPDNDLRILPEYGGQSKLEGKYTSGAPELAAEVCLSRTSYDLHQKLELYQAAGVEEYLTMLLHEKELRWQRLIQGQYQPLPVGEDGIWRSVVFPGLWLDGAALLRGDMGQVLTILQQGLNSAEHTAFVACLRQRRQS